MSDLMYDPLDEIKEAKLDAARDARRLRREIERRKEMADAGESIFDINQIIWMDL